MDEIIKLDVLPKDGDAIIKELEKENIVVARSKNDFMYILERDTEFLMFSHNLNSPEGGKKNFPKNEKNIAVIKSLIKMADSVFLVEFNKGLNLISVLASAEEGILSMYPGESRDNDDKVDFFPEKRID